MMLLDRRRFLNLAARVGTFCSMDRLFPSFANSENSSLLTASDYRSTRQFVTTEFGRIAYIDRGKGKAALFLHGFPLNNYQWRGVIGRVSTRRRCIAPDFLGLGYTEVHNGQSVAPTAQVAMIAALLDRLSIRQADLVANDSGGAAAQLFLVKYPERVRSILLTNCDTEPDSPPAAVLPVIELARAGKFADAWLAPWVANKTLARSSKGLGGIAYTYPDQLEDETIDYYLGPLVSSPERKALTNAYAVALAPNPLAGIEAALKRSRAPARIVWGTGDDIFSPTSPEYLDRIFADSRGIRRVPGAKLFFPEEFPELIADEALRLWNA